jgi:hypothetical protein
VEGGQRESSREFKSSRERTQRCSPSAREIENTNADEENTREERKEGERERNGTLVRILLWARRGARM